MATSSLDRRLVGTVLLLTLGLFGAACFLPAVDIQWVVDGGALQDTHSDEPVLDPGWDALVFGWLGGYSAWFANPALALGVVLLLCGLPRHAAAAGVVATAFGLGTWSKFGRGELYAGYYFWQASQLVFAVGACLVWPRRKRPEAQVIG